MRTYAEENNCASTMNSQRGSNFCAHNSTCDVTECCLLKPILGCFPGFETPCTSVHALALSTLGNLRNQNASRPRLHCHLYTQHCFLGLLKFSLQQ